MKKIIILALMLAVCGWLRPTQAQYTEPDTLWGLSDKFFTNFWPPRDWADQDLHYYWSRGIMSNNLYCAEFGAERYGHRVLKQFHTDDSIRVIGIGISFNQFKKPRVMDSVLIYTTDGMGNPVYRWGHEWDANSTTGNRLELPMDSHYPESCHRPPIGPSSWGYATYYMDEPIVVKDTFYAGFTQYNYADQWTDVDDLKLVSFYHTDRYDDCNWPQSTHLYSDSVGGPWTRCDMEPWVLWVWPLIDVDYQPYTEDTTATDTTLVDTTGILDVQDREWVSVWPNPAQDRVVVEAESPIQQIIVTNIQGQNIYDDRHRSAKVVLNCSWWPRGAYFVKFRTETDPALRVRKILVE